MAGIAVWAFGRCYQITAGEVTDDDETVDDRGTIELSDTADNGPMGFRGTCKPS